MSKLTFDEEVRAGLREIEEKKTALATGQLDAKKLDRIADLNADARIYVLIRIEQLIQSRTAHILEEAIRLQDSPLTEEDIESLQARHRKAMGRNLRCSSLKLVEKERERILNEERERLGLAVVQKVS